MSVGERLEAAFVPARRQRRGGGALQLLERVIFLDAARDDHGGSDAEPLVREVDSLGWLRAVELVDLKRMVRMIDPAKGQRHAVSV